MNPTTLGFVCVQNAGRSQMATAFAEREQRERGLEDHVRIRTGGTDPAGSVHDVVLTVMDEVGIDMSDRQPREITPGAIETCDIVITMGCSADGVCPATWRGDARDWDLTDPHGRSLDDVREIREAIRTRVEALFDELESQTQD
ncbi:protein-tyrosine phosphatase, low molecular weight [Natrialba chahannaoensis JCM 10990]|uniref:Protein-tyrosine phosphatase, low molecular weight n=1 Tax=Natrialba chahannaoensis JCM 10990 TaxID=1227492 RepID=M0A8Z4_9EURY|nr:low molecular weight phosphatase family protein [Natrialba chahannaoensis]ELY94841.1 protein-tyrosine phosphatase, low molecular weight [Natrialba chahannaoensis JCM 10990]